MVIGPGAIGGALAARWSEAGIPVLLMGRTPQSERALARRGLRFTGTSGRLRTVKSGLVAARARRPRPLSAIFLCVKSHKTPAALAEARAWAGPQTAVVALQNGVGHEKLVRRAFGASRAVLGVCYVAADRNAPGEIVHRGGKEIRLGKSRSNSRALSLARAWLKRGGWETPVDGSEDAMLWTKLCFNASGNPLGAVCAASNGELARDPALRELMLSALREAVSVARRSGHALSYPRMARLVVKTYPNDSRQRNSMLQDLQARRKTEVDAILGPIVAGGRRTNTPTPILSRLDRLVRALESLP